MPVYNSEIVMFIFDYYYYIFCQNRFTPCRVAMVFPPNENELTGDGQGEGKHYVLGAEGVATFKKAITLAADALKSNESHLNELDSGAGDGDCGSTIVRGITGQGFDQ